MIIRQYSIKILVVIEKTVIRNKRNKMSLQNDESTNNTNLDDRAVTDAVHSRFREPEVYCDICKVNISGNYVAISRHFNRSHPTEEYCCYCKGKVFSYVLVSCDDSTEKPKRVVYHKCIESEK